MPIGTIFIASRAGTVHTVVENAPSDGGGIGNYILIDHGDKTYAYYLHSPMDGIDVKVGDKVKQGSPLGVTGRSGKAGYPHLHFIVVKGSPAYPYEGKAISFKNASPSHTVLKSYAKYKAINY
ncbi:MAG: M23 family metallopeptidase [Calditrichaeota bacterium]|nr:MAG: M23 family peptidase [Calditrichota bacterium]MBL1207750.1 M23 family metallopeptidase [Calditrichota bacterium]NOG47584.1 M23 family metallopeptidase [Calditrichota bacterium]